MISEKLKETIRIAQICMNDSREIKSGMVFDEITIAEKNELIDYNTLAPFRCHGMIGEDLLLDAQGGRYYLAIKDGWGIEGGRLYGLKSMILLEFETPISLVEMEKMASEPVKDKGAYATMGERLKRERIREILAVLKAEQEEKER